MTSSTLPSAVQSLLAAGCSAPSADNSQPWRFFWGRNHLSVRFDTERVAGRTFGCEEHATLLAMGAVKENILQMASFLNIDVEQLDPVEANCYFRLRFKLSEKDTAQVHRHPIFQRHTNRWCYDSKTIPTQIIETLLAMSQGPYRALVFTDREMIKRIARWVQIASEVRFQTREVHEFLGRSLRFTAEEASQGDGLDVRTLPLPLGGRTFLRFIQTWETLSFFNWFGCYKMLAQIEAKPISQAKSMLAIVGPKDAKNCIDPGMLMERIWVWLNSYGIAVHPYYVITDQLQRLKKGVVPQELRSQITTMENEITTALLANQDTIHILFRIGFSNKIPVRSLRLPQKMTTEFSPTDPIHF